MMPDGERFLRKVKKKFPEIWKRFGGATALLLTLMFAAIGLQGVLAFIFGMLMVLILIIVGIFIYIMNEKERSIAQCEIFELEKKTLKQSQCEEQVEAKLVVPSSPKNLKDKRFNNQPRNSMTVELDSKTNLFNLGADQGLSGRRSAQAIISTQRLRANSEEIVADNLMTEPEESKEPMMM